VGFQWQSARETAAVLFCVFDACLAAAGSALEPNRWLGWWERLAVSDDGVDAQRLFLGIVDRSVI
jgi:hypothetical protein